MCGWQDAARLQAGGVGRATVRWRRWRLGCGCSAALKPLLPIFNSTGLSSALTHPEIARLSDVAPQPPRSPPLPLPEPSPRRSIQTAARPLKPMRCYKSVRSTYALLFYSCC